MDKIRIFTALCLGLLVLAGCTPADDNAGSAPDASEPSEADPIQGVVWEWVQVKQKSTGDVTTVPDPENYTIVFNADGTFSGQADCNQISGTYSQDGGFSISLGPVTAAFCGEESLDQEYLRLLSDIAAGGPDGAGGFALETAGGAERMEFQNGGAPQ